MMLYEDPTSRIAAHRRTTYIPTLKKGDGPAGGSKFSGVPSLAAGESWPACGNCGRPLQLFVQLAGDELPAEARERIGAGKLLQFFYCTSVDPHCESEAEAYLPHARSTLVRIVSGVSPAGAPPALPAGMFPPCRITGWARMEDYPNSDELDELGVSLEDWEIDALADEFPRAGEKLLGWPQWVQGVEYPACRICGAEMRMLLQMDSNQTLFYMFGDSGAGHITQCPIHLQELAFGWACY